MNAEERALLLALANAVKELLWSASLAEGQSGRSSAKYSHDKLSKVIEAFGKPAVQTIYENGEWYLLPAGSILPVKPNGGRLLLGEVTAEQARGMKVYPGVQVGNA